MLLFPTASFVKSQTRMISLPKIIKALKKVSASEKNFHCTQKQTIKAGLQQPLLFSENTSQNQPENKK